jgi:NADH-quinone oxidoreductase B subunit
MMKILEWAREKSPWILHFNTGGCNGCDIELVAALTPKFDVERFGIKLQGSPRHADVLAVTGPVTMQIKDRLTRVYEQTPEPKKVVAIGTCALTGAPFKDCYNVSGGIDTLLQVDAYIPGCPPKPEAIIAGIAKLISAKKEAKPVGKDE